MEPHRQIKWSRVISLVAGLTFSLTCWYWIARAAANLLG